MKYKRKNFCHMLGAELYLFTHKRSFWFAFWVMLLFSGGTYLIDVRNNFGIDISSTLRACDHFVLNYWVEGIPYFSVFFPFLVTFPVAFPSFDEEHAGSCAYSISRGSRTRRDICRALAAFLSGFLIMCIPLLLNLAWNAATFEMTANSHEGMVNSRGYFGKAGYAFEEFYHLHPWLYEIFIILHVGIFAGICGIFAYSIANYIRKYKILTALPVFLVFFVSQSLHITGYEMDMYLMCPMREIDFWPMVTVEIVMFATGTGLLIQNIRTRELL